MSRFKREIAGLDALKHRMLALSRSGAAPEDVAYATGEPLARVTSVLRHAGHLPKRSARREAVFVTMMLAEGDTGRTVYDIWRGPYRCTRGEWSADFNKGSKLETVEARRDDPRATGSLAPFPIKVVQAAEKWAAEYGLPLAHRDDLCVVGVHR